MLQENRFKDLLGESIKKIAGFIIDETHQEKSFHPQQLRQTKIQQELSNHVQTLEKKMYEGLHACIFSLNECKNLPMSTRVLQQELYDCFSSINKPEDFYKLGQRVFSGTSWKDCLGISDSCMETLYQGAKLLFEKRVYTYAEKAFFVLCALDSTQFAYWIGLGHSSFHQSHYQQSINAYSMASAIDPEDVWPHIWAANTFEEEKDFTHANMALAQALSLEKSKTSKNNKLIQSLEERIQKIKVQ